MRSELKSRDESCQLGRSPKLYSLVVKTTSTCNLACTYCYINPHNSTIGARIIDRKILEKAIASYARLADNGQGTGRAFDHASFLWHGGEPTIVGVGFFKWAFERQAQYFGDTSRIRNCLMTNGTLVDDEWIRLFAEHAVDVSVSLDGPPDIHDAHRPRRNGKGSFDGAIDAYVRLRGAGLQPGAMLVITEDAASDPARIYDFLRGLDVRSIAFVPWITRESHLSVSGYARFLTRIFDLWLEDDEPEFFIRDFDTVVTRLFGGESTLCEYNNCCGNYLALDVDGQVYSCDLFIGNPDYALGQLPTLGLDAVLESSALQSHLAKAKTLAARCRACAYAEICGGGCLYRRTLGADGIDIYCHARIRLINHITTQINRSIVQ